MDKALVVEPELERFIHDNNNSRKDVDDELLLQEWIMDSNAEINFKEQELALLRKSIEECRTIRKSEEQRLQSLGILIKERSKALEAKEKQLGSVQRELNSTCCEFDAKERDHVAIRRSVEELSVELKDKEVRLKTVEKKVAECERVLRLKEDEANWQMEVTHRMVSEYDEVQKKLKKEVEELENDIGAKEERLCMIQGLIKEREQELSARELEFHSVRMNFEWKEAELKAVVLKIEEFNNEIKAKEEELEAMQRLIDGQGKELQFKRKNLLASMQAKCLELEKKEKKLGERAKDFELRRKDFEVRRKEVEKIEGPVKEFESRQRRFDGRVRDFESEKKKYARRMHELDSREWKFEGKMKELESKRRHFEVQLKEFESKEKQFVGEVKEHESKEKEFEAQMKELESREKHYDGRVQELDLKEKHFEVQLKELESKEQQFVGQVKGHESKVNDFEAQMTKFESREKQFEGQMKDLESKKKQCEEQMEELEVKEAQFKVMLKELESNKKQLEQQVKDLKTKHNQLEEELELKEKQCKSFEEEKVLKLKEEPADGNCVGKSTNVALLFCVLKKYELVCGQVSEALRTSAKPTALVLEAMKGFCPPQFGERGANISKRTFNLLMEELKKSTPAISVDVKEEAMKLASDWKADIDVANKDCLEVLDFLKFIATFEIGSSVNENELQRLLCIIAQHCQAPQIHGDIEKLQGNQVSPTTIGGENLQLLSAKPELVDNDILVSLTASADPAKLVLDIIRKPIFPQNMKGNIIIDESHIFLFEQLMRMSPHIEPEIREDAKRLALEMKENMSRSTENSLVVLGFLLLLSIYGLVSYFNEDEVVKLVEVAAQHKQAVELIRTLGFADKVEDFVQNLIMKNQYIEAIRYIYAYKLADKIQPVNLLRQYTEYVKRFSRIGRKKCSRKKVMAKDKEIGALVSALKCISDNNIESRDLVNEISGRILSLEQQKKFIVLRMSGSSKVEVPQQLEEKKLANEAVTCKNQVQQHEEKRPANEAVVENQVLQPEGTNHANGAMAKNQVQQPEKKRPVNEEVAKNQMPQVKSKGKNHVKRVLVKKRIMKKTQPDQKKASEGASTTANQVERQQPELTNCTTEAVSTNQVQQPQQKKRSVEAVSLSGNRQFNQRSDNNKHPRTAETRCVPPPVLSYSNPPSGFIPGGMPPQLGFHTNYFGLPNPMGATSTAAAAQYGNRKVDYYYHPGPHFSLNRPL